MTTRSRPSIDDAKADSKDLLKPHSVRELATQQGVDLDDSILRFRGLIDDEDADDILRSLHTALSNR